MIGGFLAAAERQTLRRCISTGHGLSFLAGGAGAEVVLCVPRFSPVAFNALSRSSIRRVRVTSSGPFINCVHLTLKLSLMAALPLHYAVTRKCGSCCSWHRAGGYRDVPCADPDCPVSGRARAWKGVKSSFCNRRICGVLTHLSTKFRICGVVAAGEAGGNTLSILFVFMKCRSLTGPVEISNYPAWCLSR